MSGGFVAIQRCQKRVSLCPAKSYKISSLHTPTKAQSQPRLRLEQLLAITVSLVLYKNSSHPSGNPPVRFQKSSNTFPADDSATTIWQRLNHIVVKSLVRSLMVVMKAILLNTISYASLKINILFRYSDFILLINLSTTGVRLGAIGSVRIVFIPDDSSICLNPSVNNGSLS